MRPIARLLCPLGASRIGASLLGVSLLAVCLVAQPGTARAQHSFFNVPATEATEQGALFAQAQLNVAQSSTLNTTLSYGLAPMLDVGLNVFDVALPGFGGAPTVASGASGNVVMGHAIITPTFHRRLRCQFGAQLGAGDAGATFVANLWSTARFFADGFGDFVIGAYTATSSFVGRGWASGGLLGWERAIVPSRLNVVVDCVVGDNEASVAVAGLVLLLGHAQISMGWQIPLPQTRNPMGLVVELTYN